MTHGYISRLDQNVWQWFRNDSGESIPRFAVMRLTGVTTIHGRTVLTVDQPDTSTNQCYMTNGPTAVRNGKFGQGTFGPSAVIRYTGTAPSTNDEWGPKDGQWELDTTGTGFCIIGAFDTTNKFVEASSVPTSTSQTLRRTYGAAEGNSQSIAASQSSIVLEWDGSASDGVSRDTVNDHFTIDTSGLYFVHVSFDVTATAGGSSSWDILSDIEVIINFDAGTESVGKISLMGTSTNRAVVRFSVIETFTLVATEELQIEVNTGSQAVQVTDFSFVVWAAAAVGS